MAPHAIVMKTNGKSGPGNDRAAAADELRERRRLQLGVHDDDAERRNSDRADLHVGAEVVARRQQHPDRQHRRGESVDAHRERDLVLRQHEPVAERRFGDVLAEDDAEQHQPMTPMIVASLICPLRHLNM